MTRWQIAALLVLAIGAVVVVPGAPQAAESGLLTSADGILEQELMPIAYLMLDGEPAGPEGRHGGSEASLPVGNSSGADASYASALSTLGFHRTMINLYRCKGFLARRILESSYPMQPVLSKRMSAPSGNVSAGAPRHAMDAMLYDPGSTGYRDWLTKTTTLDDIYENFRATARAQGGNGSARVDATPATSPRLGQPDEYFDEGIITGYAVQPDPVPMGAKVHRELLEGETVDYEASRGDGFGFGFRRHFAAHPPPHHQLHPAFEFEEKSLEKGSLGLKDLFDIALTTLAYLSFGMFILQVIMCVTMTKTDAGMMILPTAPDVEVEEDDGRRFARALPDLAPAPDSVREQNRLAAHVLESLDIVAGRAGPTRDACLPAALCRANRYSRTVTTIHGYWIGVWSFGVSWLAGCQRASCRAPAFALKCLGATLAGLGNGHCAQLYPCPGRT